MDGYITASDAAIAIPDQAHGLGIRFAQALTLEVYARSNWYRNLVKVATAQFPTNYYWIDSGGEAVNYASGNCNNLPVEQTTISNPQTQPTYASYPLRVSAPSDLELYQFAIVNASLYGAALAQRHPGTDFFQGPVSDNLGEGTKVVAVADGTIVGYYDPVVNPSSAGPDWVQTASPTDTPGRAYVVIQHGNTIVLFAHLQPGLRIGAAGEPVVANQWIGGIGNNPAEGPHLHLEVRTNGTNPFQTALVPLTFVNAWQYFTPTIQGIIDQNIVNRYNDDQNTAPGWNGTNPASSGLQRTQCFTTSVNPPSGAPPDAVTGISVHGYDSSGNDYSAFEWVDSTGTRQVFPVPTGGTTWQSKCMP